MAALNRQDEDHLEAAQGWLGLGDWNSANDELDQINAADRALPRVLRVRYEVFAMAQRWEGAVEIARTLTKLTPSAGHCWVLLANATRYKADGGLSQAREVLIEAKARFPADHLIFYHLARCECQLGNLRAAKAWLSTALGDGAETALRGMAIDELDLQPLWDQIGNI